MVCENINFKNPMLDIFHAISRYEQVHYQLISPVFDFFVLFFTKAQQPPEGQGLLVVENS